MRYFSLCLPVILVGCGFHGAQSEVSTYITDATLLMTANVENAFDGVEQGTEYPEFSQKSSNWDQRVAENKAMRVAKVFHEANCPEIVVSPEVENQSAADLIARAASRCNYKAYSANDDQKFPVGVAIFTRKAVRKSSKIETGYRPHLRLDFVDGLTVIGVHFKSKRDGGEELRQKAAAAIKAQLGSITSGRLIVSGDFNTEEDILGGTKLQDCSENAPPSYNFKGKWQRIDKIYSTTCGEVVRMSAPFLMKNGLPYRSWFDKEANGRAIHKNEGYSDHIPLLLKK